MNELTEFVIRYGLPLIFVLVLAEQLGVPIPTLPVLVVAGALSIEHDLSVWAVIAVSVGAATIADTLWYVLGRRKGRRVLETLCRVSLSPDSCVRQTEGLFERWGMPALVVAKFVPGFSTVAPPLAGMTGVGLGRFLFYDAAGSALWAGAAVLGGVIFHRVVDQLLGLLESFGSTAVELLLGGLVLVVLVKWYERRRFYRTLRMARISVDELSRAREDGRDPLVLDVRSAPARASDPWRIAGAVPLAIEDLDTGLAELPREREIVLYCT